MPGIRFLDKRTLSHDEIIAYIRDRLLAACDDIVGIILFGSFGRAKHGKIFTCGLCCASASPPARCWAAIMHQYQHAIVLYNLDLIPTHLDGLRQGLAEHVFISMDVAFDGLVIYRGDDRAAAA